jgi:DNA-binding beta-propeller fold protein YncE
MRSQFAVIFACALAAFTGPASAAGVDLKVIAHYKAAGPGKIEGIAVDADARKIYLARGSGLDILNADTGAVASQIAIGDHVSAVMIIPDMKRGFVTNSSANSIAVFDTRSGKILNTIKSTGKTPSAIAYDEGSKRIFVANRDSGSVTALDCDTAEIAGTVQLGGKLGHLAANGYGRLFVAAPGTNIIHVVDTSMLRPLGDIPADEGEDCTGLALDPVGRRLFSACANGQIAVIDADNGATFEELKGSTGAAAGLFTFLPTGKGGWKGAAFFASANGTLTAVKMNAFVSYEVGATAKLPEGVQSIAFDSQTHHILVAAPAGANRWELLVVAQ